MGKASRRKSQRRRGIGPSRADLEQRRDREVLLAALQTMTNKFEADKEREQRAKLVWTGGSEPPPATVAPWRQDSVGDRFFSVTGIADAVDAPRLEDAALPSPQQMAGDPANWSVAVSALIRAVVLDGIPVDHPAVAQTLDLLAPVVEAEIAAEAEDDDDFPEAYGPLFLLGTFTLVDATWAIVGLDPLNQVLTLMQSQIGKALAATGSAASPASEVIAQALIRAFAEEYECTNPEDVRTLERIGRAGSGSPLADLIEAKDAAPEDALRLGLIALGALAGLARTDAYSATASGTVK